MAKRELQYYYRQTTFGWVWRYVWGLSPAGRWYFVGLENNNPRFLEIRLPVFDDRFHHPSLLRFGKGIQRPEKWSIPIQKRFLHQILLWASHAYLEVFRQPSSNNRFFRQTWRFGILIHLTKLPYSNLRRSNVCIFQQTLTRFSDVFLIVGASFTSLLQQIHFFWKPCGPYSNLLLSFRVPLVIFRFQRRYCIHLLRFVVQQYVRLF